MVSSAPRDDAQPDAHAGPAHAGSSIVRLAGPKAGPYSLFGGMVDAGSFRRLVRMSVGLGVWMGAPLLAVRLLGRTGLRGVMHTAERWWARGLLRHLHAHLTIEGQAHIRPGQAYIVTPLHESFADALALLQLPLALRFAARDELFGWPYLGGLLRDTGQIEIPPEDGTISYLRLRRAAPDVLAGGESLVVFPQGSVLGIEIDFRAGPFALALALGYPILPVVLTGGHQVWDHPFSPRLRYGQRMSLRVLPPIDPALYRERGVQAFRLDAQRLLKGAALGGVVAPPRRYVPPRDGYWDGYAFGIDPAFPELQADIVRHRARVAALADG